MGIRSLIHQVPCCYHRSFCFMTTLSSSGSPSLIGLISWVSHRNILLSSLLCPQQPQLQGTHDKTFKTIVFRASFPGTSFTVAPSFRLVIPQLLGKPPSASLGWATPPTWPESLHLTHCTLSQLHHLGAWNTGLKAEVCRQVSAQRHVLFGAQGV